MGEPGDLFVYLMLAVFFSAIAYRIGYLHGKRSERGKVAEAAVMYDALLHQIAVLREAATPSKSYGPGEKT